ncbi:unannotated protein [freshwater metagenome]|uniref:Unannotated protein n=1 Tax=freshwater metagenome TaxID=449393 RepID=A0A6J6ITZ0_9ZZZZ
MCKNRHTARPNNNLNRPFDCRRVVSDKIALVLRRQNLIECLTDRSNDSQLDQRAGDCRSPKRSAFRVKGVDEITRQTSDIRINFFDHRFEPPHTIVLCLGRFIDEVGEIRIDEIAQ